MGPWDQRRNGSVNKQGFDERQSCYLAPDCKKKGFVEVGQG